MDKKEELEKKIRALLALEYRGSKEALYLEGILVGLQGAEALHFPLIDATVRQMRGGANALL